MVEETFERRLSDMCISSNRTIHKIEDNLNGIKYVSKETVDYHTVKVKPSVVKENLISIFLDYSNYFSEERERKYYNEPYFFEEIRKLLECLHKEEYSPSFYSNYNFNKRMYFKRKPVVEYYKEIIDAFLEIHKKIPQLDPGYFHTALNASIVYFTDKNELKEVLEYYNKNKVDYFKDFPGYLLENKDIINAKVKDRKYKNKYTEEQIVKPYINLIRLLNYSSEDNQELYSSLCLKDLGHDTIIEILNHRKENYHNRYEYALKDMSLSGIKDSISDRVFSEDDLLLLKKVCYYCQGKFEEGLNDLLLKRVSEYKIFEIFIYRMFSSSEEYLKFVKVGDYTNDYFNNEKFYLNLTEEKINLIIKYANKFYHSENGLNLKFRELGFYGEENVSEKMRNYLFARKSMEEVKEFANLLKKEDEVKNKKRL